MDRRKKTTTLRSVLAVVAPLLLLAAHGVHARHLSAVPSSYVPGGVLRMWGPGSSFSGSEASGCEETYGFLPCTNSALGNLFLLLVYGCLMFLAATYMSNGSEMLLEILGPGIIGGLFLPALGALPDAILILVSGLSGSKDTAQQQVLIGMGLLAGSTVMLLTVLWGSCVVLGKCDLSENLIAIDGQDTKKFSLSGSGITTDLQTRYSARIMIISILPFIIVQLPKIFKWSTGHRLVIFIALIVSVGLLISYCVYQVFQPWIQQRRLAYSKQKHIISGILRDLQQRGLGRLLEDDGSPNEDVIRKMFHRVDDDKNGSLSRAELNALILGIQFDAKDLNFDEAIDKIMKDFDTSNDEMIDENEFVRGMCKWLDEAKCSLSNSRNFSTKFFHEFHARTREEHSLLQDKNEEEGSEGVNNPHWITLKAISLLLLGAGIAVLFADPLVDAVDNFSNATSIPSFFISFIAMPLATNSSEGVSAIIFAIRKKQKTASLTFSEIYGAVTMNNTLCLSVFLALVYVRELTWDFSSEVLIIVVVCIVMGFVASFRSTYPLWTSFVAFLLYPVSLILVYVLDFIFGWS